ncbi:MAG: hypothetical protein R3325_02520 [Thermoanaerobaculia bacterium]|nr:hypothetical protein [Thermoanaerobaculia bacterium]
MLPALPDLRRAPDFRSRRKTLFVFDASSDEWWISTWRGEEVRLAVSDLEEFLRHCQRAARGPHGASPGDS